MQIVNVKDATEMIIMTCTYIATSKSPNLFVKENTVSRKKVLKQIC